MSIPLRRYADDHVRTVVAVTAAPRLPASLLGGESLRHRHVPAAPERQERTP
ncbi:hypothetical protein AB0D34_28740 [Streptomyces sp. NPDC048420]|uniref:hypothetical protein n=1 Tax=Streptomyces sp. NPDC048420 TaxID=3155755 RepID=UPI003442CEE4